MPGIIIEQINDRPGQQLRMILRKNFSSANPIYRLTVQLKQIQTAIAVENNALTSRYQLRLTASYQLCLLKDSKRSIAGTVDALGSFNMLSYTNYIQGSSEFSNLVSAEATMERALTVLGEELVLQIQTILMDDPELKKSHFYQHTTVPEGILGFIQSDQGETGLSLTPDH